MLLGLSITVFAGWFALALLIAVGIGRAVRIAEEREEISPALPVSHFVADAVMDDDVAAVTPAKRLTLVEG